MPLKDELVLAKQSDNPPKYTSDKEQECDWTIIFKKQDGYNFAFPEGQQLSPIEQYKHLEKNNTSHCELDKTQMLAIGNFLENKVSIIQVTLILGNVSFRIRTGFVFIFCLCIDF